MISYVYFIQRGEDGPIKIGRSEDVQARLRALQTASPERLTLLGFVYEKPQATEADYHKLFAEHRIAGEWFRPHPDIKKAAGASLDIAWTLEEQRIQSGPCRYIVRYLGNGVVAEGFSDTTGAPDPDELIISIPKDLDYLKAAEVFAKLHNACLKRAQYGITNEWGLHCDERGVPYSSERNIKHAIGVLGYDKSSFAQDHCVIRVWIELEEKLNLKCPKTKFWLIVDKLRSSS